MVVILAASLTATRREPSMRLQLKTASTGTSSRSHGHSSEPGWCKPAWYGIGEWTREPWLATVTSACKMSADLDQVRTKGGTADQASVPDRMEASLYPEQDR